MIIRGCKILGFGCYLKKKAIEGTIQVQADLTKTLAEEMGWGCLYVDDDKISSGWNKNIPLVGEIAITRAKFKPSDRSAMLDIEAHVCQDFKAHRRKSDDGESEEFYVTFQVLSTAADFAAPVNEFFRDHATHTSQLTVAERQMDLGFKPGSEGVQEED